jgi:hypothetical protein
MRRDVGAVISPCGSGLRCSKSFVAARDGVGGPSDSSGDSMLISNGTTLQGFTVIEAALGGTEVAECKY